MSLQLSTRDHIGYVRGNVISATAIILSLLFIRHSTRIEWYQ